MIENVTSRVAFYRKLDELGYESYDAYLRSSHWKQLRETHREWVGEPTCFCGKTDGLQLHHRTYDRLGEEQMDDLRWLCKACHGMVHILERRREIGIDLEGLENAERAAHSTPSSTHLSGSELARTGS